MVSPELKPHPILAGERVLAVLSPANVRYLPLLKKELAQVFPRLDIVAPRNLAHLHDVVARSARRHSVVLAVGGDGSLNRVLQSIDMEGQVLGVLPGGTGNDFARTIGLPPGIKASIRHLAALKPRATDVITAGGMRCINSSGFGVDTETLRVRHQSRGLARRNYLVAFIIVLSRLKPIVAEIDCDGEAISGSFCWVLAMNSPRIGGGTRITPDASIEDGLLDVLLVKEMSKLNMLRFIPSAVRGRHLHMPWCIYRQVRRLSVRAADTVEYIALDGEEYYWGKRDVEFYCIPGGIRFLR